MTEGGRDCMVRGEREWLNKKAVRRREREKKERGRKRERITGSFNEY